MKFLTTFVAFFCFQGISFATAGEPAHQDVTFPDNSIDPLATLKLVHPRLIATAQDFDALAHTTDPLLVQTKSRILSSAEATLQSPLVSEDLEGVEHSMLSSARTALRHIVSCAMAYQLTHDIRFADRAKSEMLHVAGFRDWNPKHFLDTAEMATGVAIGYDWCYDALSSDERRTIKQALMDKALVFAPKLYGKHGTDRDQFDKELWWALSSSNWNPVCHGGMLAAALALADEEPATARQVIQGVRAYLPIALHSYGPDGAWHEGPVYWAYGTGYGVLAISMLESSLSTDFGLSTVEPAFAKTGLYDLQMHSPNGELFNYGDALADHETGAGVSPCLGWLATRFGPVLVAQACRESLRQQLKRSQAGAENGGAFSLNALWLPKAPKDVAEAALVAHFRGKADLAVFRSAWGDPDALYLGFKNGENGVNHGHLDLGSFVMDADGVRWSAMMGPDSYGLPKYFGELRWTYFRLNNYGQSTIIPGHVLQNAKAVAPIYSFRSTPDQASAIADLSAAYPDAAKKMLRGVFLQNRVRVLVQDDVTGLAANTPLNWQMVTQAKIAISADGHTATLTTQNKTLRAELLSPPNAMFKIAPAVPPTLAEDQNTGYSILLASVPSNPAITDVRVAVLLTPVGPKWPANLPTPQVEPLPRD